MALGVWEERMRETGFPGHADIFDTTLLTTALSPRVTAERHAAAFMGSSRT